MLMHYDNMLFRYVWVSPNGISSPPAPDHQPAAVRRWSNLDARFNGLRLSGLTWAGHDFPVRSRPVDGAVCPTLACMEPQVFRMDEPLFDSLS